MKVTIYWDTKHLDPKDAPRIIKKIRDRFNIPDYTTVNGETPCNIKDEDMGASQGNRTQGIYTDQK